MLITSTACKKEILAPKINLGNEKIYHEAITFPLTIVLDASQSSDPQNLALSYQWRIASGPAGATIDAPNKAATFITLVSAGIYEVELTVTNAKGKSDKRMRYLEIVKLPLPEAFAGPDQTIDAPRNFAILEGIGKNYISTYSWKQIAGNAGSILGLPTARRTPVSNLTSGIYQFELEVRNHIGSAAKDTVQITVRKPVASNGQLIFSTQPVNADYSCFIIFGSINDYLPQGAVIKEVFVSAPGKNNWENMPNIKTNPNTEIGFKYDAVNNELMLFDSWCELLEYQGYVDVKITY